MGYYDQDIPPSLANLIYGGAGMPPQQGFTPGSTSMPPALPQTFRPPTPPPAPLNFDDRWGGNQGGGGSAPAPGPVPLPPPDPRTAQASALPSPASGGQQPPTGGIFGGLRGWAPGERPMEMDTPAPPPPPASFAQRFAPAQEQPMMAGMPGVMQQQAAAMPPPSAPPPAGGPTVTGGDLASGAPMAIPPSPTPGGLGAQLGINLSPEREAAMRTRGMLASLGGGLNAAAKRAPASSPLGNFMGGAGGAIEGAEGQTREHFKEGMETTKETRAAQGQNFNQMSTAFNALMKERTTDASEIYNKAHGEYWQARAKLLAEGGAGSNAWQQTTYGRSVKAETDARQFHESRRKSLEAGWRIDQTPPEERKAALDALAKETEVERLRLYKQYGVDPKLGDAGKTKEVPFEADGMSEDMFNRTVPMAKDGIGGWYRFNGKLLQRTKPPRPTGVQRERQENQQVPANPNITAQNDLNDQGAE